MHPFGRKTEEAQKAESETSDSASMTDEKLKSETDELPSDNAGQADKLKVDEEITKNEIHSDIKDDNAGADLKFTNMFEDGENIDENEGDLVQEMTQFAKTNKVVSDHDLMDKVNEGDFPKDDEVKLNIDKIPKTVVSETETDVKTQSDGVDEAAGDKTVDDLIDSLDTSSKQSTGQEQETEVQSVAVEDSVKGQADAVSQQIDYRTQTSSTPADISVSLTPTKVVKMEESVQTDVEKETSSNVVMTENIAQVPKSTESGKVAEASGVVIDGTVFPADYFGDEIPEQTVPVEPTDAQKIQTTQTQTQESVATVTQLEPTDAQQIEPTPSHSADIVATATQHETTTSDIIGDTHSTHPKSEIQVESTVTQHAKSITSTLDDHTEQTVSTSDEISAGTETVKMDLSIEPSETVIGQSVSVSDQPDLNTAEVSSQQSMYVGQHTEAKPFVMHDTILKPSSTFREFNTEDLKKYDTPYQPSTKIQPLNQGVDVNNRYTPSVVQSSTPIRDQTLAITDSNNIIESSTENVISETPASVVESDSFTVDRAINLTVESDTVHDQVQPSLSQDTYITADFASRKTLSAESVSTEEAQGTMSTEKLPDQEEQQGQGHQHHHVPVEQQGARSQEQRGPDQGQQRQHPGHPAQQPTRQPPRQQPVVPQDKRNQKFAGRQGHPSHVQNQGTTPEPESYEPQMPPTIKPKTDENNNVDENKNYDIDPRLTRKIPDEQLDETVPKRVEPQLKFLVDMVSYYLSFA